MAWYIVYRGLGRSKSGKTYRRTYVKKIAVGDVVSKPRIVRVFYDSLTKHLLIEIEYKKYRKYRGGKKHVRTYRRTEVLGQYVDPGSVEITKNPPSGPKIDRR